MQLDVVSIGSAVLDVLLKSDKFTVTPVHQELMLCELYGGKMDVADATIVSGGAGTNTAVSFARQGFKTAAVCELGVDIAAQVIWDDLQREGVATDHLIQEPDERTGISAVLVAGDGSRSAMTYRGASHMLDLKDLQFDHLQTLRAIHLSSVGNVDDIAAVSAHCQKHNIFLSWNPSKAEVEEIFLRCTDLDRFRTKVMFVNDQEWEAIKSQEAKVRRVAETIIITRGKAGGDILTTAGDSQYVAEVVKDVVDETGAGDAFAAGFTGAILRGKSKEEAVKFGVANATSVVRHLGAKAGLLAP